MGPWGPWGRDPCEFGGPAMAAVVAMVHSNPMTASLAADLA